MVENLENKSLYGTTSPENKKIYSYEEAFETSKKYFNGDELAAKAWISKYALKDTSKQKGEEDLTNILLYEKSPEEMHQRLADEIVRIENKYVNPVEREEILKLLDHFKYIVPQGGPMSGIGNNLQVVSLSNCFVIGNKADSYGGIMKIDQEQVQLMKRRGGVGHDLSHIRPKGAPVLNSALTSTGIVPFMERYSNSTREVAQDGRRGALMLSISIKHPDAENFINAKLEEGKVTGANISVKIDDEFMLAVKEDKQYIQQYPIDSANPKFKKEINAKGLWKKIIHNAWKSAEPGILFWDTIKRESIPDVYSEEGFKTISTNPCGEIPLCPYDSCRLLAINLYSYVENPFTPGAKFNFDLFKEHVHYGQRISDDIIDLEMEKIDAIVHKINIDPEDEDVKFTERKLWENIKHTAEVGRRMGFGITGEGDMLAALGLIYGTKEATDFAVEVQKTLAIEAYRSSVKLAEERGAFPIYNAEKEKDNPFIQRINKEDPELYQEMIKHGRRNIALLTIAPTGTTSLMTQTTSGIEPVFLPVYERKKKINQNDTNAKVDEIDKEGNKWEKFKVFHHKFKDWLEINGHNPEEVSRYNDDKLEELVKTSPFYKATSEDVDWVEKVKMQGEMQKWVDHSISVTVNLPEDISEEMVGKVYETGWNSGCKGITVYRDGSRESILKKEKLETITLVQNKVKLDRRIAIKPQAIKYKVKREQNDDSLHFVLTSDLYIDENSKKAYFIPNEDFQIRAPQGGATSTTFAQSGMDRSEILKSENPDYAELIKRWQSPFSNEDEGIGPTRIKSIEHAAGLVFEDYLTRNGVVGRDKHTGELVNFVRKKDLKLVNQTKGTEDGGDYRDPLFRARANVAVFKVEQEQKKLAIIIKNIGEGLLVLDNNQKIILINVGNGMKFHEIVELQ
jgi:ribonucleoside-diphosphate reductase alpha chain